MPSVDKFSKSLQSNASRHKDTHLYSPITESAEFLLAGGVPTQDKHAASSLNTNPHARAKYEEAHVNGNEANTQEGWVGICTPAI